VTSPVEYIDTGHQSDLEAAVPAKVRELLKGDIQTAIPAIARDPALTRTIAHAVQDIATHHAMMLGDSRAIANIPERSIHLAVTSPPYWTLKEYVDAEGQLGHVQDYDQFLDELDRVWTHVLRALVPGGRLVVVVGDVCLSRRRFGRHVVVPLHAGIQERCRAIGFDNLAPVIWHKIANAQFEVPGGGGFLGKPYEPNGIIKNDIEYILFQRKSGGYRRPSPAAKVLSVIPEADHREWFQQIWTLGGASTRDHPAPFPLALAERLVRMFSFVGDTVLDPFAGTGTTNLAASKWGRHSVGIEVIPEYHAMAVKRMRRPRAKQPTLLHLEA